MSSAGGRRWWSATASAGSSPGPGRAAPRPGPGGHGLRGAPHLGVVVDRPRRRGPVRHADPTRALSETEAGDAAEWMLRRLIGDAVWERMPAGMRAERRAEGHAFMADMRSVRPPAPPPYDPAAITVPVVAAHGGQARAHHRRATGELARAAPAGRAGHHRGGRPRRPPDPPRAVRPAGAPDRGAGRRAGALRAAGGGGARPLDPAASPRPGGVRAVRGRQPRGPADRHAAGAGRARHPARPGARLLGGGDQRGRPGRGADVRRRRPHGAPVAGPRRRRPHARRPAAGGGGAGAAG